MVHIGCGADVIRQRRRRDQLRRENAANGIVEPLEFKPAKNKKYPYYTPLRNANIFSERQLLSFERKRIISNEKRSSSRPLKRYLECPHF